ncbi:MAG TPA: thiamine-phosphate kinase [Firmicutes bacterium]|nr:thiamine-phosphate kinase [Bacillota bacterium]
MDEFYLIEKIKKIIKRRPRALVRGIGDDCAVVSPPQNRKILVSSDSLAEGVHFDFRYTSAECLGRKAAAINISDIYAMGGIPLYMILNIGISLNRGAFDTEKMIRAFSRYSEKHGACLIGGDTVRAKSFFLSVTVIGEAKTEHLMTRFGAKPGDRLFVTGFPGESGAGFYALRNPKKCRGIKSSEALKKRHLEPDLDPVKSRVLARGGVVSSCLDVSDGLVSDAGRIARESSCGICIEYEKLPVSGKLRDFSRKIKKDPREFVLYGGEDYELLFTAAEESAGETVRYCAKRGVRVSDIGFVTGRSGICIEKNSKKEKVDDSKVWKHF